MKKYVFALLTVIITLSLILTSGCGAKDASSPSGEQASPSAPVSSPSGNQGTKPSVTLPSPDGAPSAEPSDEESTAPPAEEPSEAASAPPSPNPKVDDSKDYASLGFALLENDGLGILTLRLSASDLIYLLGEPESKSDAEIWGADGFEHSNWSYGSIGLEIGMAQQPDDPEAFVYSISATAPCSLATARGVKIGSPKDDVLTAYKNEIDPDANEDTDSWITVGSVYGGIGIGIEEGAVTYIFIGASSE